MMWNKSLISWITSAIFSIILANLGLQIIKQNKYIALITILTAFVLLYITYYALQIRDNEKKIEELKKKMESQEEILNTLKDRVILKKVSKLR